MRGAALELTALWEGEGAASQALGSTPDHRPLLQASRPPHETGLSTQSWQINRGPKAATVAAQGHTGGVSRDFTSGLSGPRARASLSPEASRVKREHPEQGQRCPQATGSGLWPARVLSGAFSLGRYTNWTAKTCLSKSTAHSPFRQISSP